MNLSIEFETKRHSLLSKCYYQEQHLLPASFTNVHSNYTMTAFLDSECTLLSYPFCKPLINSLLVYIISLKQNTFKAREKETNSQEIKCTGLNFSLLKKSTQKPPSSLVFANLTMYIKSCSLYILPYYIDVLSPREFLTPDWFIKGNF